MRILICIKQVPGSTNVKVDEKTGLLIRSRLGNKLNPYDLYALEEGLKIKDRMNAEINVITMGPPQAAESLSECLWMGCDKGYLVSDKAFGGADVLATSYTLNQAIKSIGKFDLIFCGKQTTDGDTAQVGAELAEHLGIPHVSNAAEIKELNESSITVKANQENIIITERIALPCLICFDSDINTPRLPSYKRKKLIGCGNISTLSLADFSDKSIASYGLEGSATRVQRIFPPEKNKERTILQESPEKLADKMLGILIEKKFLKEVQ